MEFATSGIPLTVTWITGKENAIVDALSRTLALVALVKLL
jgi:hypothetical protein